MKKSITFLAVFSSITWGSMAQVKKLQLPPGISEATTRKFVSRPSHIENISIEDNKFEHIVALPGLKATNFKAGKLYQLNVSKFSEIIHNALKDSVMGYVLQLNKNGSAISNIKWSWGQTPADASQGWDFNTRMHVASVSKYLTALGMMKALKLKNLSPDTKITGYLPAYWQKGNNIDKITFRHLLTQTTGFNTGTSSSDYDFMKGKVQAGVPAVGDYDYENMNFGLCRILIPIVMGYVDKDAAGSNLIWDLTTVAWYKKFMQDKIFTPSGVASADFEAMPPYKTAFAYNFPYNNEDGWNSGDLASVSGGAGWRLSVSDLLKVMDHAKRKGDILPASDVLYGLNNKFGIDQVIETPAGKIYNKNGRWTSGNKTEQSVIYFLPNNMEVAVLVNSYIGKSHSSLRGLVKDAFINSLE